MQRVLEGMGLIVLHSGHWSKLFKRVLGTSCALCWREAGERERGLGGRSRATPSPKGIDHCIELEHSEMYGEPFGIPTPDDLVFVSWFQGGEVFRGGCTWRRGSGRIFYFSPGSRKLSQSIIIPRSSASLPTGSAGPLRRVVAADTPRNTPIELARERIDRAWAPASMTPHGNLSR
jgi:hypothetical protein